MGFNIGVFSEQTPNNFNCNHFIDRAFYNFVNDGEQYGDQSILIQSGQYYGLDLSPLLKLVYTWDEAAFLSFTLQIFPKPGTAKVDLENVRDEAKCVEGELCNLYKIPTMEKRFTTSAQKTLSLSKSEILQTLEEGMKEDKDVRFEATKRQYIKEAKLKDGSKIVIAAFDKENGKTLAMIDYENLPPANVRSTVQKSIRQKLDKLFKAH